MDYPIERRLDGLFFRVERDGEWENKCFTDMTREEQEEVAEGRDAGWWKSVALTLAETLREIGDAFEIFAEYERDAE